MSVSEAGIDATGGEAQEGEIIMAWVYQDCREKREAGSKARWSIGWYDPVTGKRRSKKVGSKSMATKAARKLEV